MPSFVFRSEANDFHTRVESLVRPASSSGPTTTGSSLFRTLSRGVTSTKADSSSAAPRAPPTTEADVVANAGDIPSETATVEMMAQPPPQQRRRGSSFLRGMPQGDVWV